MGLGDGAEGPVRELTVVASDVAPVGGMERCAYEIVRGLHARGWSITVIARSCAVPAGPRLRFHRLLAPSRPVSIALVLSYLHGTLLVRRRRRGPLLTMMPVVANRVDVSVSQYCEPAYREQVGLPRNSRSNVAYRFNSWLSDLIELASEHWGYRPSRARRVVCVSNGLAREIERHFPAVADRISVVPMGVESDRWRPDPAARAAVRRELGLAPDAPVAVFVGGDWHRKGLRYAIEAVGREPDWSLVVVGPGDAGAFGALAERVGAGARVHFVGRQPDPRRHLAAADALVFPTLYETFSLVALEAAAVGLVLIVPPVNGVEERIEDGVNGWLTPAETDAIADRLRELGRDPGRMAEMKRAARASALRYTWETTVDDYESLITALASGADASTRS